MFEFLLSEQGKMRRHASNWLEVAQRVYNFRRDQLTDAQTQKLIAATGELKTRVKERADASKLKMAIEKLENVLREVGGRQYPMSSLVENVEFFLVAAIVILGLRAYFVQPFKIPTNSMWPTYYGMTHELYKQPAEEPGALARAGRFLAFGATHYEAVAPTDGDVLVPVVQYPSGGYGTLESEKTGRMLGVIPTARKEFTFSVAGQLVRLEVPAEFSLQDVLGDKFANGGGRDAWLTYVMRQLRFNMSNLERSSVSVVSGGRTFDLPAYWVPIGKAVRKGEKIVSFDILTGDLLFVDRISYNFFKPKVGQGFVFKTDNIHSPEMLDNRGEQVQQYYIKRLVGAPGDTLEVKDSTLWSNGKPIEGAAAFQMNAKREGKYPGYTAYGELAPGQKVTVAAHNYYAMGDNSPNSKDSRYWGFVPEKDVVGRPLFIYYPLTRRWGPAR